MGIAALLGCGRMSSLETNLGQIDDLSTIEGRVSVAAWSGAPIVVVLLRVKRGPPVVLDRRVLSLPGAYRFRAEPRYALRVFAFVDENGDLAAQPEEPGAVHADTIHVGDAHDGRRRWTGVDLRIGDEAGALAALASDPDVDLDLRDLAAGEPCDLADPRFSRAAADQGLWRPMEFILEHSAGIYSVGAYRPQTLPVVFLHGMGGSPRELAPLIEALDATRHHPFVAHYPSGWDLDEVADYFDALLRETAHRYGFSRVALVAHSMGGLVAHRAVRDQWLDPEVCVLVTIAAPLGGHPAAGLGVRMSPTVVPAWVDLDPESEFVAAVAREPLPEGVAHTLVFTYLDDTVPLASQIPLVLQERAATLRGLPLGHTEVLEAAETARLVREAVAGCDAGSGGSP